MVRNLENHESTRMSSKANNYRVVEMAYKISVHSWLKEVNENQNKDSVLSLLARKTFVTFVYFCNKGNATGKQCNSQQESYA